MWGFPPKLLIEIAVWKVLGFQSKAGKSMKIIWLRPSATIVWSWLVCDSNHWRNESGILKVCLTIIDWENSDEHCKIWDDPFLEKPQLHSPVTLKKFQLLSLEGWFPGIISAECSCWCEPMESRRQCGYNWPHHLPGHREKDVWSNPLSPCLLCHSFLENSRKLLSASC